MKSGNGYVVKRSRSKVIRYCRYDVRKDPENFFRELVMLFKPWRNEKIDVENCDCEEIYKKNQKEVTKNKLCCVVVESFFANHFSKYYIK